MEVLVVTESLEADASSHVALGGGCCCAGAPPATRQVQVFGEIHAKKDLHRRLRVSHPATDGELFAAAWSRWGQAALQQIHGEYSAVVVHPEDGSVTLVSDHIGTHRLFWSLDGTCLRFATSLDRLLPSLPRTPDPDAVTVGHFLVNPGSTGPRTFLDRINVVEAGSLTVVHRSGRVHTDRWWRPEEIEPATRLDRGQFIADLSEILFEAVSDRLRSREPFGVHLSGGLDSTLVMLMTKQALEAEGRPLRHAYTWSPPVSTLDPTMAGRDERQSLTALAEDSGLTLHTSSRDSNDMLSFLRRPVEREGVADVFDEISTIQSAAEDGVQVLLTGWGGDEALSVVAPSMPAHHLRNGRLAMAALSIRTLNGGFRPFPQLARVGWRHLLLPLLPPAVQRISPFYTDIYRGGCYIGPALATEASPADLAVHPRVSADPRNDLFGILGRGHIGERMSTWRAWAAPVGVRHSYPLTDRRLMEHVLSAPIELLWGDGRPRYPARAILAGRTRQTLSKGDPANQRQRLRMFRDTWRILGDEVRSGRMNDGCDWLDMSALRRDLLRGPSGDGASDVMTLARMTPALRVLDLWRRYT